MRVYLGLLLSLAAIWGASYMFIEIALDDFAPTTLMAGRVVVASLVLVGLMAARGTVGRLRRAGWRAFALGIINSAVPFTLIAWGQEHIDSGVAAIANATVPIWVALLAIWLPPERARDRLRIVGIVVGLAGVAVLTGSQPDGDGWAVTGTLAVVLASVLYARREPAAAAPDRAPRHAHALDGDDARRDWSCCSRSASPRRRHDAPGWAAVGSVVALGVAGTASAC